MSENDGIGSNVEFYAMAQGKVDYEIPVIRIHTEKFGDMITIMAQEGAIYVTKEQAMKFFNYKKSSK